MAKQPLHIRCGGRTCKIQGQHKTVYHNTCQTCRITLDDRIEGPMFCKIHSLNPEFEAQLRETIAARQPSPTV